MGARPTTGGVALGDRFEQVNPPPGYPPTTVTIVSLVGLDQGWVHVRYAPGGISGPIQIASLWNQRLWRKCEPEPIVEGTYTGYARANEPRVTLSGDPLIAAAFIVVLALVFLLASTIAGITALVGFALGASFITYTERR